MSTSTEEQQPSVPSTVHRGLVPFQKKCISSPKDGASNATTGKTGAPVKSSKPSPDSTPTTVHLAPTRKERSESGSFGMKAPFALSRAQEAPVIPSMTAAASSASPNPKPQPSLTRDESTEQKSEPSTERALPDAIEQPNLPGTKRNDSVPITDPNLATSILPVTLLAPPPPATLPPRHPSSKLQAKSQVPPESPTTVPIGHPTSNLHATLQVPPPPHPTITPRHPSSNLQATLPEPLPPPPPPCFYTDRVKPNFSLPFPLHMLPCPLPPLAPRSKCLYPSQGKNKKRSLDTVASGPVVFLRTAAGPVAFPVKKKRKTRKESEPTNMAKNAVEFAKLIQASKYQELSLKDAMRLMGVTQRRLYDVIHILEGAGLIVQSASGHNRAYKWNPGSGVTEGSRLSTEQSDAIQAQQKEVDRLTKQEQELDSMIALMKVNTKKFSKNKLFFYASLGDIAGCGIPKDDQSTTMIVAGQEGCGLTLQQPAGAKHPKGFLVTPPVINRKPRKALSVEDRRPQVFLMEDGKCCRIPLKAVNEAGLASPPPSPPTTMSSPSTMMRASNISPSRSQNSSQDAAADLETSRYTMPPLMSFPSHTSSSGSQSPDTVIKGPDHAASEAARASTSKGDLESQAYPKPLQCKGSSSIGSYACADDLETAILLTQLQNRTG